MAISLVQSKKDNTNSSITFNSTPTSGNLVVVNVTKSTSVAFVDGDVTDNKGNTYTLVRNQNSSSDGDQGAIFYAKNITSSATFTITYPGGGTISIAEYSGVDTVSPLNQQNSSSGSSNTPDSGNVTVANNGELFVGLAWSLNNGDSWAANNGFTIRQSEIDNNTYERHAFADKIGDAQTTSANFTVGSSALWLCLIATFKAAGGSSTPTSIKTLLGHGFIPSPRQN